MIKKRIAALCVVALMCFTMLPVFAAVPTVTANASYDAVAKKVTITGTATSSQVVVTIKHDGVDTPDYYGFANVTNGNYTVVRSWGTKPLNDYNVIVENQNDNTVANTSFSSKIVDVELQNAKNSAKENINVAFGTYKEADYTAEKWTALVAIKDVALEAVETATTVANVNTIETEAIANMSKVEVIKSAADIVKDLINGLDSHYNREYILSTVNAFNALTDQQKASIDSTLVTKLNDAKTDVENAEYTIEKGTVIDTSYGKVVNINLSQGLAPNLNNGKILIVTTMNDNTQVLQMTNYSQTIGVSKPAGNIKSVTVYVMDLGSSVLNTVYYGYSVIN